MQTANPPLSQNQTALLLQSREPLPALLNLPGAGGASVEPSRYHLRRVALRKQVCRRSTWLRTSQSSVIACSHFGSCSAVSMLSQIPEVPMDSTHTHTQHYTTLVVQPLCFKRVLNLGLQGSWVKPQNPKRVPDRKATCHCHECRVGSPAACICLFSSSDAESTPTNYSYLDSRPAAMSQCHDRALNLFSALRAYQISNNVRDVVLNPNISYIGVISV